MAPPEKPHIRPKVRAGCSTAPSKNDIDDIDVLVEHTRQQLKSWTTVPSSTTTKNSALNSNKAPTVDKTAEAPKGILRTPKYSSKSSKHEAEVVAQASAKVASAAEKNLVQEKPRAAVKDLVVERDPSTFPQTPPKPNSSFSVEGYTPSTSAENDEEPLVFSSLSDIMEKAGTLPAQNSAAPQMVEADLSFACMTPEEYEESVRHADSVDSNDLNDTPDSKSRDDVVHSQNGLLFSDDDNDEGSEGNSDEEELTDFLSESYEDDEPAETSKPRAFMRIWTALMDWITPEAVALIQDWREIRPGDSVVASADLVPQVDRSDVGASRCAGLMAMVKMHLTASLDELSYPFEDKRRAEQRLSDFLRTLNYENPMAKFDSRMWKAMTCVLLDMVLMGPSEGENRPATLPPAASNVGMVADEYRYLVHSAITSFGESSIQNEG